MSSYRVISSDSHVNEPADLWTSRADSRFRDRVPHVESLETGDVWFYDGTRGDPAGNSVTVGIRFEAPEKMGTRIPRIDETRPGGLYPRRARKRPGPGRDRHGHHLSHNRCQGVRRARQRHTDLQLYALQRLDCGILQRSPQAPQGHRHAQRGRRGGWRQGDGTLRQAGLYRRNDCRLSSPGPVLRPAGVRAFVGCGTGPGDAHQPARRHQPPW